MKTSVSVAVLLLATSIASVAGVTAARAAPFSPGSFYASVFGGYAMGAGTVTSYAHEQEGNGNFNNNNNNNNNFNNGYFFENDDAAGHVGNGYLFGMAIGTMLDQHSRVEFELSHLALQTSTNAVHTEGYFNNNNNVNGYTNITTDSIGATFALANYWYDIDTGGGITPYVGGGVGVAHVMGRFAGDFSSSDDPSSYLDQTVDAFGPAAQIGAGIKIALSSNMMLDLGYRYKATVVPTVIDTDAEVENGSEISYYGGSNLLFLSAHTVQAGLTVGF